MQGTAAEKLALFEKLKARGGLFAGEDRAELLKLERMLAMFAPLEKVWRQVIRRTVRKRLTCRLLIGVRAGLCARGGIEAHGRNRAPRPGYAWSVAAFLMLRNC